MPEHILPRGQRAAVAAARNDGHSITYSSVSINGLRDQSLSRPLRPGRQQAIALCAAKRDARRKLASCIKKISRHCRTQHLANREADRHLPDGSLWFSAG